MGDLGGEGGSPVWGRWPSGSRGSGPHGRVGGNGAATGARRRQVVVTVAVVGALMAVAGVGVWLAGSSPPGGDGLRGADGDDESAADVDGHTWSRVAVDDAEADGFGGAIMHSVMAGGPGLVAVGTGAFGPDGVAAVWTSPDGHTWSRVAHDEAVFGGAGRQAMHAVAAGGPGLVAVGEDTGERAAAVWTSPDGHTWSRVAHDEAVFGGAPDAAGPTGPGEPGGPVGPGVAMSSVAAGGPGLVAVGQDSSQGAAAVWISPDGHTWSRVAHDEAVFGGTTGPEGASGSGAVMTSVTAGGPGLVAVGHDVDADTLTSTAAVWTSPDGHTWSRVVADEAVFGGSGGPMMTSVTAGGPGLVAVGELHAEATPAVWTSPDGHTWSRVANVDTGSGGQQQMNSVATAGSGLVAVGAAAIGPQDPTAAVWTSPDGHTWSQVADDEAVFGGAGGQRLWSVTAGGPGLVAVGTAGAADPVPAVWVSD